MLEPIFIGSNDAPLKQRTQSSVGKKPKQLSCPELVPGDDLVWKSGESGLELGSSAGRVSAIGVQFTSQS